jgi:hypothetical protein
MAIGTSTSSVKARIAINFAERVMVSILLGIFEPPGSRLSPIALVLAL